MAFSNYKSISSVIKKFQIKYVQSNFMLEVEFPAKESFKEELDLLFTDGVIDNSEDAICENLIYPVLKEVWKPYRSKLTLWSHEALAYDEDLSGIPDYTVAQRNSLSTIVFDKPYFLIVEAKQDKFEEGWSQCLAEMIAVQRINDDFVSDIFGIVSNGKIWQFGKLVGDVFTRNKNLYMIQDLDKLFAAVNYIFQQCELKIQKH
ncbi:hypothetical protein PN480_20625 [Dolichospermum circinale CS-1225]|jgi:hypothetical protein|uniref:Uncharacterized protein n=1 Tax=Dolichospermum circinale CS-537/01 TaxID=3021739 RepID=A0ABT5A2C9_9CYAN|nr:MULTISPECIES: hypothetical protein [Dolichospermum]MBD1215402.1 hypothetical protein [Dolichospermum circinale Clear-D4]MCE2720391.1 hypothetical protein [Anabaena sp. 49628_E55]MDB9459222.1 hypothetical protein [Dolichospermum circinale CS-545/17]MBD2445320.1 hypothetical protein [Dolichospermum sp. FACHB-1091]MDB9455088.1 hypothetical protein [Dolichospermum circinale CS-541/06]